MSKFTIRNNHKAFHSDMFWLQVRAKAKHPDFTQCVRPIAGGDWWCLVYVWLGYEAESYCNTLVALLLQAIQPEELITTMNDQQQLMSGAQLGLGGCAQFVRFP